MITASSLELPFFCAFVSHSSMPPSHSQSARVQMQILHICKTQYSYAGSNVVHILDCKLKSEHRLGSMVLWFKMPDI